MGTRAGRSTQKRYTNAEFKDHDIAVARKIVRAGLKCMGLKPGDLPKLRKGDERKALIAHILMEQTSVRQKWVVQSLHMGSPPYVSRLAKLMGERIAQGDHGMRTLKNEIVKVLSRPQFGAREIRQDDRILVLDAD